MTHHLDLDALSLKAGKHNTPDEGLCMLEAVAYFVHEPHTDHPECVSPVIGQFLRTWNDDLDDEGRQRLKPYIPRVVATNTGFEDDQRRGWMLADWVIRHQTPAWLELAGLNDQAATLRALPTVESWQAVTDAEQPLSAAESAARSAAWSAAWSAARSAAWSAAWSAARSAAREVLRPTEVSLQESTFKLLDRMIAVGAEVPA